jgi:PQQ-like domain
MSPTRLRVLGCGALVLFASGGAGLHPLTAGRSAWAIAHHHLEDDSSSWAQYRGNARRTGFAPWRTALEPEILWKLPLGPMIDASPVVGTDGTIYVAGPKTPVSQMDELVAVNPDGTVKWHTILDGFQLRATPAVHGDGSIVAVGHNAYADRVDRDDEGNVTSVSWKRETRMFLVAPDGDVRARTDQTRFFDGPGLSSPAYDGADGAFEWQLYPVAGGNLRRFDSSLAMTSLGGLTVTIEGSSYVPYPPRWVQALCAVTLGLSCWPCVVIELAGGDCRFSPRPVEPGPSPADPLTPSVSLTQCNDAVAPAYESARFWNTGGRQWQKGIFAVATAAIGAGGRAYIPTLDSEEGAIDGRDQDGDRRFFYKLPRHVAPSGPPALGRGAKDPGDDSVVECRRSDSPHDHRVIRDPAADNLYITGSDGDLYAIDYKGRGRWTAKEYGFTGPPVVLGLPDGRDIIVVASLHSLRGLRGEDGEAIWKVTLDPSFPVGDTPVRGSPAVHGDRIYIATEHELYAIGYRRPLPTPLATPER